MKPCKHLDFNRERYPHCQIVEITGFACRVRHWRRGEHWTGNVNGEKKNPQNVQYCGAGRGRINGIFQCYNKGEMPCYEPDAGEETT